MSINNIIYKTNNINIELDNLKKINYDINDYIKDIDNETSLNLNELQNFINLINDIDNTINGYIDGTIYD
jgi:hypothetical protein